MAQGDYEGSGEAFLGDAPVGRIRWHLIGTETPLLRKAGGTATFETTQRDGFVGKSLSVQPDNGDAPFRLIVTSVSARGMHVDVYGDMPWWP